MSCGHSHYLPLPPVTDPSQAGKLADEWALAIHLGDMAPGAPLREMELADSHGVSRTIVRAALQRIEAQGLAEIALNKGARVKSVSPQAAQDLIALHAELLAMTARKAAANVTPGILARMHEFVDLMEHIAEDAGPPREIQHLRVGFGRLLNEAAGPVWAERLRMAAPVIPHHDLALEDVRSAEGQLIVVRLSRDVLTALARSDADAAADAARALVDHHAESVHAATSIATSGVGRSDYAA